MSATRVVLVRHGESQAAIDGRMGGHAGCSGLSELGCRQAKALRDRLTASGELRDAAVLATSLLRRAQQTAAIIAPGVGDGTLAAVEDCDLCEWHPEAEADGELLVELVRTHGSDEPMPPGFNQVRRSETWGDFGIRVERGLGRLVDAHRGERIVVVCHGGVIAHSFGAFAGGIPPFPFTINHTGMAEWEEREPGEWRLVRLNDTAHLAAAGVPT